MNADYAIRLTNVSKRFTIPARREETTLSCIIHSLRGARKRIPVDHSLWALKDIHLTVHPGEVVGVVGNNASGKSTLLRIIAGILLPDSGTRDIRGPVTSLMNLGAGLKYQLTVRDNIFLACSLYGMTRRTTQNIFDAIVEFGELRDCLDMFAYQLSGGMIQRLTFSIAVFSDPDILLLDEVFSAGDIGLKEKSERKMEEMIRSHITVVIVSHEMKVLRRLCDRVVWLEHGVIRMMGTPEDVLSAYEAVALAA